MSNGSYIYDWDNPHDQEECRARQQWRHEQCDERCGHLSNEAYQHVLDMLADCDYADANGDDIEADEIFSDIIGFIEDERVWEDMGFYNSASWDDDYYSELSRARNARQEERFRLNEEERDREEQRQVYAARGLTPLEEWDE